MLAQTISYTTDGFIKTDGGLVFKGNFISIKLLHVVLIVTNSAQIGEYVFVSSNEGQMLEFWNEFIRHDVNTACQGPKVVL